MYVLTLNSVDDCRMQTTFCGLFETHEEAHADMVNRVELHRNALAKDHQESSDSLIVLVDDDTGCLDDGGMFDGRYHESYFIFDTEDPGQTFEY
ncbi:MAG: hypothetical protein IJ781_05425 [Atopobiaceae bacterium]|nr:hypothetical protein [Atopobiaceae bacterium]